MTLVLPKRELWTPKRPALIRPGQEIARRQGAGRARQPLQMLLANQLAGFGAGGNFGPASVTYVTNRVLGTNTTVYPFTGTSISAAGARHVAVAVGVSHNGGDTRTIDSVTVGGNASAMVEEVETTNLSAGLYIISFPSGTTADIVVTVSNTVNMCGIGVWAVYNLRSPAKFNTTASEVASTSTAVGFPSTESAPDGVGIWYVINIAGARTFSWSGASERFDAAIEADGAVGTSTHTGADVTTTGANVAPAVTVSGGAELAIGVGATFR